ncbi:glycosyltransferase [Desulfosporosinus meridiei]|uniref:Glycosyltransferase n=1 Tax=Desulfosporosinus meridiei (strain ATCC BAA-275 / DSM 13257 / KCTC 12902 / NCIMB 13706 / S10) TaxID=768704 RepID=J7J1Z3_DESMD|nr:glycosyltransferase [Desulfosporosinus meridiei]AFQ46349.1 glycosyltransferase [Desulfosporosinus meridiei DSM 13257]
MKKKSKILHIIGGGEVGGAEKHVLSVLQNLDRTRFDPHLICLTNGPFSDIVKENHIPVSTFPMRFPIDLTPLPSLINWINRQSIDLIHTHGSRANLLGRLSAKWLSLPCLTTIHSSLAHDYLSPWSARIALGLDRLTLPLTSAIITVSDYLGREVKLRGGRNLKTIYNGYSSISFNKPESDRLNFRKKWGIPKDALVLGTIGRLHPTKGQIYLIQAATQLLLKFPNLHLLIIGDGPLRGDLASELQRHTIPHTFTGYLPTAYQALPAMDLFVLPSISEGMGLVLLEAMQAGIPIVASAVGGIPEVIRNGKEGLLFSAGNVTDLTSKCLTIFESQALAQSLVQAGQNRWPMFSIDSMIKETEQVYISVLNQANTSTMA